MVQIDLFRLIDDPPSASPPGHTENTQRIIHHSHRMPPVHDLLDLRPLALRDAPE